MNISAAYNALFSFALVILMLGALVCLIRAISGPKTVDRIVSINIICTLTVAMICIFALMLDEAYLIDVAMVYTMLGFLAVVVISKVYMGVAIQKEKKHLISDKAKEEN